MRRLHLDPRPTPPARLVGSTRFLDDHTFVEGPDGLCIELGRRGTIVGHDGGDQLGGRDDRLQRLPALQGRPIDEIGSVEVEDVEVERGQHLRLVVAPESAHRILERLRRAVAADEQRLAVEDHRGQRQRPRLGHDLGHAVGEVVQVSGEHLNPVTIAMHLDPQAVQFPLDGGAAKRLNGVLRRLGGLGQHGLQRGEDG